MKILGNTVTCTAWIVILGVCCTCTSGITIPKGKKSYKDYKLLQTQIIDSLDVARSLLMLDGILDVQFWKYPLVNQTAEILASPKQLTLVKDVLRHLKIKHSVVVENIEDLDTMENLNEYSVEPKKMNWKNYQRYSVIKQWVSRMAERESIFTSEVIGTSSEGREIQLVKISTGGNGSKPAIWMDGGMHAREWISPATVTYMMNKLVTDNSTETEDLLEKFDWYIVPIVNVDGYEFSHSTDRYWRKTRSINSRRPSCPGVDPNRNWAFHWAEAGSSSDPCSGTYHGPRAFSEPETAAVSNAILQYKDQIKMYLTFHSYSQLLLIPWGYTQHKKPVDYKDLITLALEGKNAIDIPYGTKYKMGTAPDLLYYSASGGSFDWAKGVAGIKYAYCFELRDTGRHRFSLPPNQIIPSGEETFAGVAALANALFKTLSDSEAAG